MHVKVYPFYPVHGSDKCGKIRFVSTSENRGNPGLIGKNVRIVLSVRCVLTKLPQRSLSGVTRLCQLMLESDPESRIFLYTTKTLDRLFFLNTFQSPALIDLFIDFKRYTPVVTQSSWRPPFESWRYLSHHDDIILATDPASILRKSTSGRHRPVSYPDGPMTARYRFT